jgi:TPR repeat protein
VSRPRFICLIAAVGLVCAVPTTGTNADSEVQPRTVPLVGALADRAKVEAEFKTGVEAYDRSDFAGAYDAWLPLAQTGDPAAQRNIAHLYRNGLGVRQDFALAAEWYRRAADAGLARAQANLAMMYLRGQGVTVDASQAAHWFQAAATQGHVIAQYNLGLMYLRGVGMPKSEAKAIAWLHRASKSGHKKSIETLSQLVAGPTTAAVDNNDATKSGKDVNATDSRPVQSMVVQDSSPKVVRVEDLQKTDEDDTADSGVITAADLIKGNEDSAEADADANTRTAMTGQAVKQQSTGFKLRQQTNSLKPITVTRIDTSGLPPASTDPNPPRKTGPPAASTADVASRNQGLQLGVPSELTIAAAAIAANKGDYAVAMKRLNSLAEANNAEAQYRLAHLYLKRANTKGDPAFGYFWLARAELSGHPKAHVERTRLDMALKRDELFRGRRILQDWRRDSQ